MNFFKRILLLEILNNQGGFIRPFGPRFLLEPKKEGDGGSGGGKKEEDKEEDKETDPEPGAKDKDKTKDKEKEGELDLSTLDPRVQKLIKDLRKEAGDNRAKKKESDELISRLKKAIGGEEDDEEDVETKLTKSQERAQSLELRSAYLEMAIEHGISSSNFDYFEFLMNKACSELGDSEELGEEEFESILSKVKAAGGSGTNTTSTKGGGGNPPKKKDEITLEQFRKMGMTEKTKLYQSNRELYDSLIAQQ